MERLPEFIANHLFLFSLLTALLMLLIWNLLGDQISGIKALLPADLTRLINHENAVVVDLRPVEDFKSGHIINSINLPAAELEDRKSDLDKYKDKPLVFYCQNGTESGRLVRKFKLEGFTNMATLKGGLMAWKNANMPLTREDA